MENLRMLSKQELLEGAKALVLKELKIGLQLLEYLREIEVQMIYAEMGFESMWNFCVSYLGLSEGDAQRKISTMRLCKVIPEVKEDLQNGKISMTNAAKVQSFFNAEKRAGKELPLERKKEVLESVHGLSKIECESKLMELSPTSAIPSERIRPITQDHSELKVLLNSETIENLEQLKGLLAHTLGDANYQTLIQYMAEETLKRVKKAKGLETQPSGKEPELRKTAANPMSPPPEKVKKAPTEALAEVSHRKAIPAEIKRMVYRRAGGRCEYQSEDGRRCNSQHRIEINHKTVVALGGTNELDNLELTCRNHNVLHAYQTFGHSHR